MAASSFGLEVDVKLSPENALPMKQSSPPLPIALLGLDVQNPDAYALARHWVDTHLEGIHHNTPFLHPPQLYDILGRLFNRGSLDEPSLRSDELALLYIILALGSLRADTFDNVAGQHHSFAMNSDNLLNPSRSSPLLHSRPALGTGEISLALYRHSLNEMDSVDTPSETAVQALFLLHTYVSNTMMGRKSRDFVARAVMMAHEIGLNRLKPESTVGNGLSTRRAVLFLYVYFSDVRTGQPASLDQIDRLRRSNIRSYPSRAKRIWLKREHAGIIIIC